MWVITIKYSPFHIILAKITSKPVPFPSSMSFKNFQTASTGKNSSSPHFNMNYQRKKNRRRRWRFFELKHMSSQMSSQILPSQTTKRIKCNMRWYHWREEKKDFLFSSLQKLFAHINEEWLITKEIEIVSSMLFSFYSYISILYHRFLFRQCEHYRLREFPWIYLSAYPP